MFETTEATALGAPASIFHAPILAFAGAGRKACWPFFLPATASGGCTRAVPGETLRRDFWYNPRLGVPTEVEVLGRWLTCSGLSRYHHSTLGVSSVSYEKEHTT